MSNVINDRFPLKTYMKNKSNTIEEIPNDDTTNARNTRRFSADDKIISEDDYDTTLEMIDIYLDEDSALYDIEEGLRLIHKLEDVEENIYMSSLYKAYRGSKEGMSLAKLTRDLSEMYYNEGNETGDLYDK